MAFGKYSRALLNASRAGDLERQNEQLKMQRVLMPKVILIMDIKNGRDTCHSIMLHFEEVKLIKCSGSMRLLGACVEYVAASFKCGSFSLMFKNSLFMSLAKCSLFQIKQEYLICLTQIHLNIVGQFCKADSTRHVPLWSTASDKSYGLMNNTMLMENSPYFNCSESCFQDINMYTYPFCMLFLNRQLVPHIHTSLIIPLSIVMIGQCHACLL
jgi:hypothetical protein